MGESMEIKWGQVIRTFSRKEVEFQIFLFSDKKCLKMSELDQKKGFEEVEERKKETEVEKVIEKNEMMKTFNISF